MNKYESQKFKYISDNTSKLVNEMLTNQNLAKYIYYLDNEKHPLDPSNPSISPIRVRDKNFKFVLFDDNIVADTQILVFVNPAMNNYRGTTLSIDTFVMDVAIPNKYWIIHNGGDIQLRAYEIAYETAKAVDGKSITGIGDVEIVSAQTGRIGSKGISVISIVIEVKNTATKVLK